MEIAKCFLLIHSGKAFFNLPLLRFVTRYNFETGISIKHLHREIYGRRIIIQFCNELLDVLLIWCLSELKGNFAHL